MPDATGGDIPFEPRQPSLVDDLPDNGDSHTFFRESRLGRIVGRYGLTLALMVGSGVAGAVIADQIESQPSPDPPATLTTPNPSGHLKLHPILGDNPFSPETEQTIHQKIEPELYRLLGSPFQDLDIGVDSPNNTLQVGTIGQFNILQCAPNDSTATIILRNDVNEDLRNFTHEEAHLWMGCFAPRDSRFREGFADAAALLISQRLQIQSAPNQNVVSTGTVPDIACCLSTYENINRPGIGGGLLLTSETFPLLSALRISLASQFFASFEQQHPGFMRSFNVKLYERLHAGMSYDQIDLLSLGDSVAPGFAKAFNAQQVFKPRPVGGSLLSLPYRDGLEIVAISRDSAAKEYPLKNLAVDVVIKPEHGQAVNFRASTDDNGNLAVPYEKYGLNKSSGKIEVVTTEVGNPNFKDDYSFQL